MWVSRPAGDHCIEAGTIRTATQCAPCDEKVSRDRILRPSGISKRNTCVVLLSQRAPSGFLEFLGRSLGILSEGSPVANKQQKLN